ncbi:aminotransferase class I/II-fold pyridoxal phosphate-dependent enzyme [Nocardia farcinica]|uniref:Phenylalanine aminotransferase n=1 Tax=Nocardia farcinica TaxID=37329 RepID=A0A449H599_NOCFR|nr:aminotransferase class I/II-fold pyridoxal phosphate-dependent enzyme [Nocardia farcinica]MBF6069037.1 aminotransferase class I/II-fold pyridoxal phosphate-dependent enzyme [Nocardia farcinica]MBF6140644.1 aminotransferase class I/II-fold pyridoxal phosphate-dependent enzyme [Nocardia farcinica]MBF6232370.1 aminotransferase class I/II-fold pyridoxal phosphate-dependent enzyme [Nocardia farcinica]MBF6312265.1 aminotransferase class I/II-fold pyridoxal phosphate-dependent enzyme [Nocardia farc
MTLDLAEDSRSARRSGRRPPCRFDLSLSENPYPPLPSVLHAVQQTLAGANRYPEFRPRTLPELIAGHLGLHPEQVVVGAGATGVAAQIMAALAGPGAELVTATPTFDGYPILAEMTGTVLVPVPCDAAGAPDPAALGMAVHKRTALVVICRPHNPTGALITAAALRAFLRGLPERVTVVLDEAYVEFLAPADRLDTTALLRAHPNVLVLRTFSKAYGLAGLRIGYAFGDRARMASVRRHQLPFGVPATATAAVAACYAARPELTRRVARITAERDGLRAALRARGRAVPRSHANFLYLPGPGVATALRRAGITAKAYPDGSARIAVGDPAAGRAVLAALTGGGSMDG